MKILVIFIVFLVGAVVGSFLNVCIYRLPRTAFSLRSPLFSFCPKCEKPIPFYDNLPIVSYLLLKGKCRCCGGSISALYPFVEVLTGLLALAAFWRFGFSLAALWSFILFSVLLVVAFIDFEHMFIPDSLSIGGTLVSLVLSPLIFDSSFLDSLLGVLAGAGFIFIVNFIYKMLSGRDGFGWGDVKLFAFIGAAFAWQSLFWILFVSAFFGSLIGLYVLIYNIDTIHDPASRQMPFAPFVAVGAVSYCLFYQGFISSLFCF